MGDLFGKFSPGQPNAKPYSYFEINPSVEPTRYWETPKFSPFGSGRLDRETGTTAPLPKAVDMSGVEEQRNAILREPLSEQEVSKLVERYRHSDCSHQKPNLCTNPFLKMPPTEHLLIVTIVSAGEFRKLFTLLDASI
ncbi:hypothetical protein R6Q57_018144 [Mikania cordata]